MLAAALLALKLLLLASMVFTLNLLLSKLLLLLLTVLLNGGSQCSVPRGRIPADQVLVAHLDQAAVACMRGRLPDCISATQSRR